VAATTLKLIEELSAHIKKVGLLMRYSSLSFSEKMVLMQESQRMLVKARDYLKELEEE